METKDMKTIGAGGLPTIGAPVSSGTGGDVVITPDVKYESYTAASGDTSITDILPEEGEEDVIYRVGNWDGTEVDATKMSEYAWDGSDYTLLRVVDSIGEVFDISAYNASGGTLATYADLAAALGTSGANVPEGVRKGGMSVKYVQSSDNNYVQFRYMPSDASTVATFTNVANWQGVDAEPTAGSKNLVRSGGVYATMQEKNPIAEQSFFDVWAFTESGYLSQTGELVSHSAFKTTDFIKVAEGSIVKYLELRGLANYPLIACYDENKVFKSSISASGSSESGTYTIPTNIAYVRFVTYFAPSNYSSTVSITNYIEKEDETYNIVNKVTEKYIRHKNICEENIWHLNYYINASTGRLTSTTGDVYTASNLLKVRPNSKIFIFGVDSVNGIISIAFYDENFSFLASDSISGSQGYKLGRIITIPSTAQYARFVLRNITGSYRGYVKTISAEIYSNEIEIEKSELEGKTVVFLGDSITAGANVAPVMDGTIKPYPYLVASKTGIFPIVIAAPGGYFAYATNEYSIPYQVELISYKPDIIVIEGGVNDYAANRTFGTVDYGSATMYSNTLEDNTFCGGLEKTIRTCATRFPGVPIMFVIATKARNYEWTPNSAGNTYRNYVDEIIKICKKYGVFVVNLHDEANLIPQMAQYYENEVYTYQGDNLHPTTLSYEIFYVNRIEKAIQKVLSISE